MTVQDSTLSDIKSAALDVFDDLTHMGFSTDTSAEDSSDTTLASEVIRNAFSETALKNVGTGEYSFEGYLGLTDANSNTLGSSACFNASTSGTMRVLSKWGATVDKDSTKDLSCGMKVTVSVVNS